MLFRSKNWTKNRTNAVGSLFLHSLIQECLFQISSFESLRVFRLILPLSFKFLHFFLFYHSLYLYARISNNILELKKELKLHSYNLSSFRFPKQQLKTKSNLDIIFQLLFSFYLLCFTSKICF